jgi:hypothetical protein
VGIRGAPGPNLDLRDLLLGSLGIRPVNRGRSVQHQQPRGVNVRARLGYVVQNRALRSNSQTAPLRALRTNALPAA